MNIEHRSHRTPRVQRGEDGAVLMMVLLMMLVGMLLIGSLLTYNSASLGLSGTGGRRNQRAEAAEGAVKMAIAQRKTMSPALACVAPADYTFGTSVAHVECERKVTPTVIANGAYGLVTSTMDPAVVPLTSNRPLTLNGNVFIAGGKVDAMKVTTKYEVTLGRYSLSPNSFSAGGVVTNCTDAAVVTKVQAATASPPASVTCVDEQWMNRAGQYSGPGSWAKAVTLPPMPSAKRTGASYTNAAGCKIYFPGRYNGLTISSGEHYFASGTYYFDGAVNITGGKVVGGSGTTLGCTFDAEAALNPAAPTTTFVSGKGVLLVFGGAGKLSISGSATDVQLNRHQPGTLDNLGGKDASIVTVHSRVQTATFTHDESVVKSASNAYTPVSTYSIIPQGGGAAVKYVPSTVGMAANAVTINVGGTSNVRIGGLIWTGASGLSVRQSAATASVRLEFGAVVHHAAFNIADAAKVWVGTPDKADVITQFLLTATSGGTTSKAVMEYNQYGENVTRSFEVDSK